jgi:PAS domain S-box-containing protein
VLVRWRQWRRRGILIPLVLVGVIFGLTLYLEFHEREAFIESRSMVIHSHEVIEGAQTLLSQIQDAQSGQRGYLLTRDPAYLAPYERAARALPGSMAALRSSVKGDAAQLARTEQLDGIVQARLGELAGAIAAEEAHPGAGPRSGVSLGEVSIEQVRLSAGRLIAAEKVLLEQRRSRYEALRTRTFSTVIAANLAAMGGLLYAVWVMIGGARVLERRMAERDEAEAARRESDARYAAIFANAADYLFVADVMPDGTFAMADANPAWQAATGYSTRNVQRNIDNPEILRMQREHYRQIVETRRPLTFRSTMQTKSGPRSWETTLAPVFDRGRLVRIIGCGRDVSARAQAEEQVRRAQRMEAVGQLTGGVAHDFNNLLQVIRANLELLASRFAEDEIASQRLKSALHGADRAAQLTRQLLAFARRQPLEPKVVNLGRLVTEMSDLLRRSVGESITVENSIAPNLWNTLVDPAQVESAVLNLALNARDAMPRGGRLAITLANAVLGEDEVKDLEDVAPGAYVALTMSDNGQGMAPDVLSRVFEPFFTTKGEEKGTGLGLSMVYGFVKQSKGHIQLASDAGQGTTVKLLLPRSQLVEERPLEPPAEGGVRIDTVLVVEDEPAVRAAACAMLQELGYRCLEAADGASALEQLERGAQVQLLFTDMVMPGPVKSTELAARAREMHPELPILFTSGYAESAVMREARLAHGAQLLSKPYSRAALAAKIQAAIQTVQPVVLVVEDDPLVRLSAIDMVEDLGFVAVPAGDARQALELLRAGDRYDVLFTDVGLPDMKGLELAEAALELQPHLSVVFASGYAEDDAAPEGAVWLSKPYEQRELAKALGGMSGRRPPTPDPEPSGADDDANVVPITAARRT